MKTIKQVLVDHVVALRAIAAKILCSDTSSGKYAAEIKTELLLKAAELEAEVS